MSPEVFSARQTQGVSALVTAPDDQARLTGWTFKSDRHLLAEAMYEDFTSDMRPELAAITTPVTVIVPMILPVLMT